VSFSARATACVPARREKLPESTGGGP
jgi:hypothetical protein